MPKIHWVNCKAFKLFLDGGADDVPIKSNVRPRDWPENSVFVKALHHNKGGKHEITMFSVNFTGTKPNTPYRYQYQPSVPIETWIFSRGYGSATNVNKFDRVVTNSVAYDPVKIADNLILFNYVVDRIQKINNKILAP